MSDAPTPPGWYGKLPSLGDFASRRLAPGFLAVWDTWLAQGMQQLQQGNPAGWLDAYLASPTRRFLLMPGVLAAPAPGRPDPPAWAGVLMPSVDRVGRYFPFTIVQPVHGLPMSAPQMQQLWCWLGQLDELAADALHDDWPVQRLEAELAGLAGPGDPALAAHATAPTRADAATAAATLPHTPGALVALPLPPGHDIAQQIDLQAQALWQQQAHGVAYWYACTELLAPSLLVSRGLPASAAALLGATI